MPRAAVATSVRDDLAGQNTQRFAQVIRIPSTAPIH